MSLGLHAEMPLVLIHAWKSCKSSLRVLLSLTKMGLSGPCGLHDAQGLAWSMEHLRVVPCRVLWHQPGSLIMLESVS